MATVASIQFNDCKLNDRELMIEMGFQPPHPTPLQPILQALPRRLSICSENTSTKKTTCLPSRYREMQTQRLHSEFSQFSHSSCSGIHLMVSKRHAQGCPVSQQQDRINRINSLTTQSLSLTIKHIITIPTTSGFIFLN